MLFSDNGRLVEIVFLVIVMNFVCYDNKMMREWELKVVVEYREWY